MSRSQTIAVRNHISAAIAVLGLGMTFTGFDPLQAQDEANVTSQAEAIPGTASKAAKPDVIDILAPVPQAPYDPNYEAECERQADAGIISGEIIVCARRADDSEFRTVTDSQKRYAEETAFINDPQAPDVAGPGIFKGKPTIGGICLIPPCPPPKAIIVDVEALPEAPPGSDADRVGRGLPPIGNDDGSARPIEALRISGALALPGPQIDYAAPDLDDSANILDEVNSEGSAEPAAPR